MPLILEWFGLAFGFAFVILTIQTAQSDIPEPLKTIHIGITGSLAIGLWALFNSVGAQQRLDHHKRILKKHGLWQDESIKKKELPKD